MDNKFDPEVGKLKIKIKKKKNLEIPLNIKNKPKKLN